MVTSPCLSKVSRAPIERLFRDTTTPASVNRVEKNSDPTWPRLAFLLPIGLSSIGLLAIAVGLLLIFTAPSPASFGWTAYTPLSPIWPNPLMTGPGQAGLVLSIGGLTLLTFCIGWMLGLRQAAGRG